MLPPAPTSPPRPSRCSTTTASSSARSASASPASATRSSTTQAKHLGVEPRQDLAKSRVGKSALADASDALRKRIEAEKKRRAAEPEYGTPESVGVDQSTLDAIAACESGGDPTAVDASGTYHGKYQFDLQTWASVGGSGDPAAAPEAEQDYRAALLMSRAGSSPWPVCG